jgi:uncharacterized phage protein (TIGR02218 family)
VRDIPEALTAKLASGVTTLAHAWRVERRDGQVFAFTDHDCPLPFDDLIAEPVQGVASGAIDKSTDLSVDSASIVGALSSEAITEADIARGFWDNARIDIYRVDWAAPDERVHLFAGHIGEVRRGALAFEAELRGLQAALNVPVGRVFSRFCDADLGDVRCGVNIDAPEFRGEGVVTEVLGTHAFRASGIETYADGWFTRGRIVWDGGATNEVAAHRSDDGGAIIDLLDRAQLALDDVFVIYAGCDKRIETCRAKFANVVNFRGFPHMPGNDTLQAGPTAGERLDGSSRLT